MSFRSHIDVAFRHLETLGISPEIREDESVSEKQLNDAEKEMEIALPNELRRYFLELGDGFQLWYSAEPITGNEDNQFWWTIDFLSDIVGDYQGIREDMGRNIEGNGNFCDTDECKAESRNRINWIPIFGIGGGGYTFCIDANEGKGNIRYHDIRMCDGYFPSIHLADSIDDWMTRWSRYCFSQPLCDGTDTHISYDGTRNCISFSFCESTSGSNVSRSRYTSGLTIRCCDNMGNVISTSASSGTGF